MSNIRTVIPLVEFKSKLKHWLSHLEESQRPILVTRHGRGLFVVQPIEMYAGMAELATEGRHQLALNEVLSSIEE